MKKLSSTILITVMLMSSSILCAINVMPIIAAFQGEHHSSDYGYSMESLDFNHDGFDDLAVCSFAYGYNYGITPARGKIYIYYGGLGFNSGTPATVTVEGTYASSVGRRIWGIFKVGDISGDGFDDLCVHIEDHISWNESYEKLLIFYGGTTNLDNPDHVIDLFGSVYMFNMILPLGDINGDGYGDMGFYYRHSPSYLNRLSIIWGYSFQEQVVSAGEASSSYSRSIHGIGDINGDGYGDFTTAFATPTTNPTHNLIRLYYGNAAGNTDNPITMIYCQYGVSRGSKPLGDMNADGYDDFMGYITDDGMHAWLGGQIINYAVPSFNMDPPWYGGDSQRSLEHGDFNNDGYEDAVGAHYGNRGFAVWLGKQHVNGTSDLIIYNAAYENFGYSLVTGDFNADGYDDIAIAASHEYNPWPTGNFNGYVWVYAGNAQLEDTTVAIDDPVVPGVGDQFSIRVSPNPVTSAHQSISISIKGTVPNATEAVSIEIFNIKGQSVYRASYQNLTGDEAIPLNMESLGNGIYLCRVINGKYKATCRFSVVK